MNSEVSPSMNPRPQPSNHRGALPRLHLLVPQLIVTGLSAQDDAVLQ